MHLTDIEKGTFLKAEFQTCIIEILIVFQQTNMFEEEIYFFFIKKRTHIKANIVNEDQYPEPNN